MSIDKFEELARAADRIAEGLRLAARAVAVYRDPCSGRYQQVVTMPFGIDVLLPQPIALALDTRSLERWAA
ncbi:hypothetical protein [Nocardia sp. NPDC057030]|uniref:hypothetical protein n=1 Tax=unclassified Nocardia TaxID=2637762 RepID=UPI00363A4655